MNKPFPREHPTETDDDGDVQDASPLPAGARNYMTPGGFARMRRELDMLVSKERPELVATSAWAAGNGDRSENADYIYGKRRLREIDRRIRFLNQRLEIAEVIEPARSGLEQVFFGATVVYRDAKGATRTISIVGQDEVDPPRG